VKATVKIFGAQGDDIDLPEIMQLYAEVGNLTTVFGNPKIWIGRRLYDRHDIHINDYWFLNTLQEMDAGGVSGINLGIGKLSLAIGRDTAEGVSPSGLDITQSNIDVRLSDIPLNKNGTIMLWGLYSLSDGKDGVMSAAGWAGGIMHTQTEFFGGYNKFMLQYGTGLARKAGEGYGTAGLDSSLGKVLTSSDKDNLEEARTIRMTNQNVIEISDSWSLMTALVWESRDSKAFDGAEQDWLSLGVRPIFYVTDNFRVPVEVGYDYVDDKAADIDGALLKITLAAEASLAKGFWARPVARAFVTYADWAKDWQGQVGGSTFSGKSDGWSAGLQFETWW